MTIPPLPLLQTMSLQELQKDFGSTSPTDTNNNQTATNGPRLSYVAFNPSANAAGQVNAACEQGGIASHRTSTCSTIPVSDVDPILTAPPFVNFHTIILDMSGVCFVDLMGTKALGKVRYFTDSAPNFVLRSCIAHCSYYVLKLPIELS